MSIIKKAQDELLKNVECRKIERVEYNIREITTHKLRIEQLETENQSIETGGMDDEFTELKEGEGQKRYFSRN